MTHDENNPISEKDASAELTRLLMKHQNAIYAYIMACVRNYADADDILQNVAMVIVQSKDGPVQDERFMAWAREIARRRVLEHQRKSKRLLPIDPAVAERLADAAAKVEAARSGPTRRDYLMACIEKLPEESKRLIAARYQDEDADMTCLARRFNRSEQGIYSLLYRIRTALRRCVKTSMQAEGMA